MKAKFIFLMVPIFMLHACNTKPEKKANPDGFKFLTEQFADIKIMRYQVPDFDSLSLKQKELVYYLSQAALCGRDIVFDQNYKNNLLIRRTLENIYEHFEGDRNTDDFARFVVYLKKVWFSNGIHHHYSTQKFIPDFSPEYFDFLVSKSPSAQFAFLKGENMDAFMKRITPLIFDPAIDAKKICLDSSKDLIAESASNFYEGITQKEAESFYAAMTKPGDPEPISYGLNSKLVKQKGKIFEKTYKVDGMYGQAIGKVVYWLEKALVVAENDLQKQWLSKLIDYYHTGDLKTWDEYNILWVKDTLSMVDVVNGFIEVYGDPMGMKATWESVVSFKNIEASRRTKIISDNAQWFEDNSPVEQRFKRDKVKGVSAKVITVVQLGGDCYPSTPIGINLPNADWIRAHYGSKSVTMENITYAYDQASLGNGFLEEFAASEAEIDRYRLYGSLADNLHTDLHECLGHGSGKTLEGVSTDVLKNYYSAIEEARADLFGLYFMADKKMIELGLFSSPELPKAQYDHYIRNGLIGQLVRIEPGKDIEQAHMRCRKLIAEWVYENGKALKAVEKFSRNGKTYVRINNYETVRTLFGKLLAEIQRIKSTGDYEAAKNLVETYAVKVDQELHREILERFKKLNLAPYGGFINPQLTPVYTNDSLMDIKISYPDDFTRQMLEYSKHYSYLPDYN